MATKKKTGDKDIVNTFDRTKAIYESNELTINGRKYKILALNHKTRLKVFSYYSSIESHAVTGDFGFMDTPKYQEVEKTILDNISCNSIVIGTKTDYFDGEAGGDYIELVMTMLDVFSYPLLTGSLTN